MVKRGRIAMHPYEMRNVWSGDAGLRACVPGGYKIRRYECRGLFGRPQVDRPYRKEYVYNP
jgi:hypothetical protein